MKDFEQTLDAYLTEYRSLTILGNINLGRESRVRSAPDIRY